MTCSGAKRVLALISDTPCPPVSGGRVRNFYLWPSLRRLGANVRIIGIDARRNNLEGAPGAPPGIPSEFFRRDRRPLPLRALNAALHSHHEWPRSDAMAAKVDEVVAAWQPDIIHAEELRMAFYLPRFRGRPGQAVQTVTLHNVETRLQRQLGSAPWRSFNGLINRLHGLSLARYERRVVSSVDIAFAYSPVDYNEYCTLYPNAHWSITRNGTNVRAISPAPQVAEPKILIVGTLSYAPNIGGLLWFIEQVMPRLTATASVTVAGSGASSETRSLLARNRITFVDTPEDLRQLYEEHAVCAVPVLEGSGTRGKILEACAYERMVITTPLGLEGLDLRPAQEGVIVADDAENFARELNRYLPAVKERAALASRGRQAVLHRYDWSVVAADLLEHWSRCGSH
jgi:glycosyltransferase involved in cell wall biosynthesis